MFAGVVVLAYTAATLFWRDPATDLYASWKQHDLSASLDGTFTEYRETAALAAARAPSRDIAAAKRSTAKAAVRFQRTLELGEPIGRIIVPKLNLRKVFVHGTRWGPDLSRGPGHYPETPLPGVGRTVAIAGHRTTFGAPFRHIDDLAPGNVVVLELPYGTFRYRVFKHEIVRSNDWSIIRPRGFDALVLSACHPLYSAKRRWIVYARLVEVEPVRGEPYALARES